MDVVDADMCLVEPEDNLLPYFDYLLSQPEEEPYWNSIFELISEFSADGHGVPADPLTLINPDLLYQTEENSEGLSESISSNYSPPPTLNSTPEPEPTSEEELITGQDCLPLANLDSLMEEEKYELLQFIATDLQEKLPNYVGTMWLMPSLRDLEEKTRHRYYRDTDSFLAYLHDLYENYDRHVTPNEKKNLMKHIHIIQFYLDQCANCYLNYYQYPKDWFP
ncbi:hypothetical protein HDE_08286 [Halotydeus destructor]|nr:hypothetical protein HDE_08286 [Halotydeus destructor]